jgi:predicted amidohydrolase
MPRLVNFAALQMDATPAPTAARLQRAAALIAEAAAAGAELVALPELFNVGYVYSEHNFVRAERLNGPTVTWMQAQARAHNVHVAGTLLLLDEEDIYNAALLIAPDGRTWRYDKHYPWLWERTYFREGSRITIADTALGRLGMMICWDAAHADLWQRYAGRVDAMLILSSPPKMSAADLVFPDGRRVNISELGPLWKNHIYTEQEYFPGVDLEARAAWLGVPIVHTTGAGTFRTHLPHPRLSLISYVMQRPDLWRFLPQAASVVVEAGFDPQARVVAADGVVRQRVTSSGDGWALAQVELPSTPPPAAPQPPMRTAPLAYVLSDIVGPALVLDIYRRGTRRTWGAHMAPLAAQTRRWLLLISAALVVGWLWGRTRR